MVSLLTSPCSTTEQLVTPSNGFIDTRTADTHAQNRRDSEHSKKRAGQAPWVIHDGAPDRTVYRPS